MKKQPRTSAPKSASFLENTFEELVSADTVLRTFHQNDYNSRVARRKPLIKQKNKTKRVVFAREYVKKDGDFGNDVIFSDENKFNLFGSNGRIMVWRKVFEDFEVRNFEPTVKHGGSVMVWGCVSSHGVGSLHFIEDIMLKEQYLAILQDHLEGMF